MAAHTIETVPLERTSDHLLVVHTDVDLAKDAEFDAWEEQNLGPLLSLEGLTRPERFVADPDQRPGEINRPPREHMSLYGYSGDASVLHAALRSASAGPEVVIRSYGAVGDFVRKSDGLPGSRGVPAADVAEPVNAAEHIFMAQTNATPGREKEFNSWYDDEHVPDVVAVQPFHSGRRFHLRNAYGHPAPWSYLSLYRFEGPVPEMHRILKREAARNRLTLTGAIEPRDAGWVFTKV